MPKKKYIVTLTDEQRALLEELVRKDENQGDRVNHARILLLADTEAKNGGWKDAEISQALKISVSTIARIRQRFVELSMTAALNRKLPQTQKRKKLDGEKEAHLLAIAGSEAPQGRKRWTLRMLADKMVELNYVDRISHETIRQTLKKKNCTLVLKSYG